MAKRKAAVAALPADWLRVAVTPPYVCPGDGSLPETPLLAFVSECGSDPRVGGFLGLAVVFPGTSAFRPVQPSGTPAGVVAELVVRATDVEVSV